MNLRSVSGLLNDVRAGCPFISTKWEHHTRKIFSMLECTRLWLDSRKFPLLVV